MYDEMTIHQLQYDPDGYWIYYDLCLSNNWVDDYFSYYEYLPQTIINNWGSPDDVSWQGIRCASGQEGHSLRIRSGANRWWSTYVSSAQYVSSAHYI